ncbi:unnamed protein product, partial [Nesidiocoris tenuis]
KYKRGNHTNGSTRNRSLSPTRPVARHSAALAGPQLLDTPKSPAAEDSSVEFRGRP